MAKRSARFNYHRTYEHTKTLTTRVCARCTNEFTMEMGRKKHTLCPPCKPVAERERLARRARIKSSEHVVKKKKLIPYAGYCGERSNW